MRRFLAKDEGSITENMGTLPIFSIPCGVSELVFRVVGSGYRVHSVSRGGKLCGDSFGHLNIFFRAIFSFFVPVGQVSRFCYGSYLSTFSFQSMYLGTNLRKLTTLTSLHKKQKKRREKNAIDMAIFKCPKLSPHNFPPRDTE